MNTFTLQYYLLRCRLVGCELLKHDESDYSIHFHSVNILDWLEYLVSRLTFGKLATPTLLWIIAEHNRTHDVVEIDTKKYDVHIVFQNKLWYELMEALREDDSDYFRTD